MSHVLLRRGASVTGFALAPATTPSLFERSGLHKHMQSREGDIRDLEAVARAMRDCRAEIVIHMAAQALVRDSYLDPVGTFATNVMGTVNTFEAARLAEPAVFINVTSDKCYENREWVWGYRENEAMGGSDPYSASKGCAELVTQSYRRSFFKDGRTRLASVRAGNVIGGGDWAKDRLIPDAARAFSQGEKVKIRQPRSTRPWQHVLEPVNGYLQLAEKMWDDASLADGWNFGPDQDGARSVDWVMSQFCKAWGAGAEYLVQEATSELKEAVLLHLDCSKARSRLGWGARTNVTQALEWTANWYRDFYTDSAATTLVERDIKAFDARLDRSNNEAQGASVF